MSLEWRVIEPKLRSGAEIVAIDDTIHSYVGQEKSPPTLIFYHWDNVLSIGKPQSISDINIKKCKEYGIDVVRTVGGGRAVLHLGMNDISYSLIVPSNGRNFEMIYEEFCGKIAQALRSLKIPIEIREKNDFYVREEKKISGNALRLGQGAVTQHGIILYKPHPAALMISLMNPKMYDAEDVLELEKKLTSVIEQNPNVTMQHIIAAITEQLTEGEFKKDDLSFAEKAEVSRKQRVYERIDWFEGRSQRGLCWLSKGELRGSLRGH